MRDHRHFLFYSDRIEPGRLFLDPAETTHAVAALRLTKGNPLLVTDGLGTIFDCKFEAIVKHRLAGTIISRQTVPRHPFTLHLLVGLPERGAFESLLADCTALGVTRITPLICSHCQQAWWERSAEKLAARFRNKMIASLKQSLHPWLPRLDPPLPFQNIRSLITGFCMLADPEGIPLPPSPANGENSHPSIVGLVGPPGGFAPEESVALKALGVLNVKVAPTRLTTELASVVLCGQIIGARLREAAGPSSPGSAA